MPRFHSDSGNLADARGWKLRYRVQWFLAVDLVREGSGEDGYSKSSCVVVQNPEF
jgi:hypothetical protein